MKSCESCGRPLPAEGGAFGEGRYCCAACERVGEGLPAHRPASARAPSGQYSHAHQAGGHPAPRQHAPGDLDFDRGPQEAGYQPPQQPAGYGAPQTPAGHQHDPQPTGHQQHGGYPHPPQQPGYQHPPQQHGYQHPPQQPGYQHPQHAGYQHPQHAGYQHQPQQPGYQHGGPPYPQQGGYGVDASGRARSGGHPHGGSGQHPAHGQHAAYGDTHGGYGHGGGALTGYSGGEHEVQQAFHSQCGVCGGPGPLDVHHTHFIWSVIFFTSWHSKARVSCTPCARKSSGVALLACTLFGWWGFPAGIIGTPVQIVRNLFGLVKQVPTEPSDEFRDLLYGPY